MSDTTAEPNDDCPNDGYDIFSAQYESGQHGMWADLRASACPVARTDKWGASWMLVAYDDVHGALHDPATFSSRAVEIAGAVPPVGRG